MSLPLWWAMHAQAIAQAGESHGLATNVLGGLVWQESNGGLHPRTLQWTLAQLYRYEPAFWTKYLAGKPEYQPPAGADDPRTLEAWKRRVSASWGLCHVMYATARDHGYPAGAAPEGLLMPRVGLDWAGRILRRHLDRTGTLERALEAYNGGGRPDLDRNGVDDYVDEVLDKVARLVRAGA